MALILVADDDPMVLRVVTDILEARGHQVVGVSDGLQLAEKAETMRPALIVADIQMPNVYGTAAAGQVQENPRTKGTPVLFITGLPLENASKIVVEGPAVRLMAKPLDIDEFGAAVDELLKARPA